MEDLDGEVLCSFHSLKNYRNKLLLEDASLIPCYCDEASLKEYINNIYIQNFS